MALSAGGDLGIVKATIEARNHPSEGSGSKFLKLDLFCELMASSTVCESGGNGRGSPIPQVGVRGLP